MKKNICTSIALLLLCVGTLLIFSGCMGSLKLATELGELKAGETFQLAFTFGSKEISSEELYYASADTTVVSVSDTGLITALREGQTSVTVQHKQHPNRRATVDVTVKYDVRDELSVIFDTTKYTINNPDDAQLYPFFDRNGYSARVDDWDIRSIANIVMNKSEDDYVFTDVYNTAWGQNDTLILLADWGNTDVSLSESVLAKLDLSTFLTERIGLGEDCFSQVGEDIAMQTVKTKIATAMANLDYEIALSRLSTEYEYRVSIVIGYHTYQTDNFYSRGLFKGGWQLIQDIWNWDITSFLNSYTYTQTVDEMVLNGCELVIERRLK